MLRRRILGEISDEDIQKIGPLLADYDNETEKVRRELRELLEGLDSQNAVDVASITDRLFGIIRNIITEIQNATSIAVRMDQKEKEENNA